MAERGFVFASKEAKDLARRLRVKYDAELLDSAFTGLKLVYQADEYIKVRDYELKQFRHRCKATGN